MSDGGIFLVQDDGLVLLEPTPYDSEAVLQEALAAYPAVLAGVTTIGGPSHQLLLVRREQGVPTNQGGGAMFSLDHLFIADDAVPVLVEVKRESDTRSRREVVAQMLDYAANGVRFWPVADLRAGVEAQATATGCSPVEHLQTQLGVDDVDAFWDKVESNMAAGRVRMVFVADRLPDTLVRIIEFLNEQMTPAEVLGVELRQYTGAGHQALVPRLVGRTTEAVTTKGTTWTRDQFIAQVNERLGEPSAQAVESLLDHAEARATAVNFGRGQSPGVSVHYQLRGGDSRPVWYLQARVGSAIPRGSFMLYRRELPQPALPPDGSNPNTPLLGVPLLADSLIPEATQGTWLGTGAIDLETLASTDGATGAILEAIDSVTDPPG